MSSVVFHETIEIEMQQIVGKLQAYGGTEPSRRRFVTRVYALFAAQLLLMILLRAVYIFNDGLLTWMSTGGIWPCYAVFEIAFAFAYFLDDFLSSCRKTHFATSVFSVFLTHELTLYTAADKTGLIQRMPIDFFVVLVILTVCSKYWPNFISRVSHYAMSSLVAFPSLIVLHFLLRFESLQLEVFGFVLKILLVMLTAFYTSNIVDKHMSEHVYVVALKLHSNVMWRIAFVMFFVLAVVRIFTS